MAVKKNIEDIEGKDNYPCGQQLLIHNGKVLKDETTLADNKVSEDGFLVVMLSKVFFKKTKLFSYYIGKSFNFRLFPSVFFTLIVNFICDIINKMGI